MKVSLRAEGVQGGPKHFFVVAAESYTLHFIWPEGSHDSCKRKPEGLLLSLDTDKLWGTPPPQKENIPSFHDITQPGMEEGGRTAGEGEERKRRRGWHSWWQPQYHLLLTNSSCCFTYTPTTQQQPNEWEACCRGPPRLQRFLIDNYPHLLHSRAIPQSPQFHFFTSPAITSGTNPSSAWVLRLHRKGFGLLPCHVTFIMCLKQMQSDKFPATTVI